MDPNGKITNVTQFSALEKLSVELEPDIDHQSPTTAFESMPSTLS